MGYGILYSVMVGTSDSCALYELPAGDDDDDDDGGG